MSPRKIHVELQKLMPIIHGIAQGHGFWKESSIHQKTVLVVYELAEMVEAHRKDKQVSGSDRALIVEGSLSMGNYINMIKGTVEEEIADTIIRCLDLITGYDFRYLPDTLPMRLTHNFSDSVCDIMEAVLQARWNIADTASSAWSQIINTMVEFARMEDIPILEIVKIKIEYNSTQPHKHGKNY